MLCLEEALDLFFDFTDHLKSAASLRRKYRWFLADVAFFLQICVLPGGNNHEMTIKSSRLSSFIYRITMFIFSVEEGSKSSPELLNHKFSLWNRLIPTEKLQKEFGVDCANAEKLQGLFSGEYRIERNNSWHKRVLADRKRKMVEKSMLVNICHKCGKLESKKTQLKLCNRCRTIRYCSVGHQKADWRRHKGECLCRKCGKLRKCKCW